MEKILLNIFVLLTNMFSLFFYLVSSLLCVISANIIKNDQYKIVDIVHNNLPYFHAPYISDILVLFQTITAVIFIDNQTLSEMFLIMGITQLCRVLCSASTVLPPLKNYHDKYRLGGINGSGTEYIFSGHASYSALSAIYLYSQNLIGLFPLIIFNSVSQLLIVLTKNHYTVDVVLAWIIVPLIYGNIYFCRQIQECNNYIQNML